ncbi:Bro-N domain-containing protein [Mycobacteroides abscessus]|uniref:BRO-N domain-containing protein n=1 Tax=Mycobacteroides abscessus TaxID=36809 RepID=UPI00160376AA|nr:BRO family protein [Mycobacteroides abscessus]
MSAPQLFTNGEFELPVLPDGDSFRVNGMVVARQLGFRYAADMVRTLADDEKVFIEKPSSPQHANLRAGGDRGVWFVTEPGFYRAVGQRNVNLIKDRKVRDAVARFQRWVFHEVVPAMVRSGQVDECMLSGTTWSWVDVSFEIRQRYGLDYSPSRTVRNARAPDGYATTAPFRSTRIGANSGLQAPRTTFCRMRFRTWCPKCCQSYSRSATHRRTSTN